MSKIGRKILDIPSGVQIYKINNYILITNNQNALSLYMNYITFLIHDNKIIIRPMNKKYNQFHGLYNTLLYNMITGLTETFSKELVLKGVGFSAKITDNSLTLNLGFSHDIVLPIPKDIFVTSLNPYRNIIVSGFSKERVGLFSAKIKHLRKPDPYLGKGIRYTNEIIKIKPGKTNVK